MAPMARFGENLKALRQALRMNQKELAANLVNEDGGPMAQSGLSKLEQLELSPRTQTVQRLAEGLAPLMKLTPREVAARLMHGVSSRFDAVQAARAESALDRLKGLIDTLDPEQRAALEDALERRAQSFVKQHRRSDAHRHRLDKK